MADQGPETSLSLASAGEAASERHRPRPGPASPIAAWTSLQRTQSWLHEVRLACADPPAAAGKAAEWLLDNDYQVHRALRQIGRDLPQAFYDRLPAEAGEGRLPRIFLVAHDFLAASRLQISLAGAVRFVCAYQKRAPLTIAELWAFPTMLRLACIEILVAAMTPFFDQRIALPFAPSAFARDPHSLDETERVARGIANLAVVANISWDDFFDRTSQIEEILRRDPSGDYPRMDFETRDRYRRAVEKIGESAGLDERRVAAAAVARCRTAGAAFGRLHVGHWLIGEGRPELETALKARLSRTERWKRRLLARPGPFYAAALAAAILGALLLPILYLWRLGAAPEDYAVVLALAFIPASTLAVAFVHWTVTRLVPPRILPKLDLRDGLTPDCATVVTVPVVIGTVAEVAGLMEQLETHWLANADPLLRIALLADPADAPEENRETDEALLRTLTDGIERLNRRYGETAPGPFHLLVRSRRYNEAQGCWMAWERKRGKLEQFNRLLLEGDSGDFALETGDGEALRRVRFVVTVDADTMLPPGSVTRLAGTLAHPLNRPRLDDTGRVVSGFSIVQPRTEISPRSGGRTWFTRLFTGDTSIDIYSRAVSDVYQDLFGSGIFVGKGIYDLQAFHRSVDGRVPENSILSHDLFEGAHGRVALATDIVLYEGFPATYAEYSRRIHRWTRGDWQLLPWLRRWVPAADGPRVRSRFSTLDRWKILDNLRRSLVAPAMLALAVGGWLILPGSPWFWTLLAVCSPAGQLVSDLVSGLARGRRRAANPGLATRMGDQAGRWFLAIAYLVHEALIALHAIALTLWRLAVSRRRLLEWTTAAQVAASLAGGATRAAVWRQMAPGAALALVIGIAVAWLRPAALLPAAPLLLLWIAAPEIAFRLGRTRPAVLTRLSADDRLYLRGLARRTWLFFETFAGPDDNWLPPDNYQSEPHEEIAHRTSPTNIGMMLLSTATAWDLGHIGRYELAARTANVFESLARLERYRGHFLNWYDTRTLKPLEPRYVSTVDSGNLAVSLVACAAALREAAHASSLEPQRWAGLADVAGLLRESIPSLGAEGEAVLAALDRFQARLAAIAADRAYWPVLLSEVCHIALPELEATLAEAAARSAHLEVQSVRLLYTWTDRLRHQARNMLDDLERTDAVGQRLIDLAAQAEAMADAMEFAPLYDRERRLFFIGYNETTGRTDQHHYDLLASEARLASFFAIAKGDVPLEHWFHLERPVVRSDHGLALLSWNGSMFEYLMPRLLLRSGADTLLGESEKAAVEMQRRYGEASGTLWGISESAFASRDPDHRYRYQAFGVPGLGLRRGLARDRVVAPYASALALATDPVAATRNLRALDRLAPDDRYGLLEAVDYTPDRLEPGQDFAPVLAFMAHHQGMILCAIGNALNDDLLVARFARDPRVRLVSLLLSERLPREIPPEIERLEERERPAGPARILCMPAPWTPAAAAPFPQVNLLGNGRLSSWVSEAGGGMLRWRKAALTRFIPDAARDATGLWIYVADEEDGALWSATRQPTGAPADEYHASFRADFAEFNRKDHDIRLRLEIGVGAGDDIEIRRLTLANESGRPRRLRVTSYAEIALAPAIEDERHPAFSKLFVESRPEAALGGLLFARRPRGSGETPPVLLHLVIGPDGPIEEATFECDRMRFLGRGRDARQPAGATADLGNGAGATLDPVLALQTRLSLGPYERRELCFLTIAAPTRKAAIEIAGRYATLSSIEWALGDAASECARVVDRARMDPAGFPGLMTIASLLVHPHRAMRAPPERVRANRLGQPGLWGLALSGDYPILLLRIGAQGGALLPDLVSGHHWWRRHGLDCDLVILQGGGSAYAEPVRGEIAGLLRDLGAGEMLGRSGGIHLLFADQIGPEQVRLLEASAAVLLDENAGSLADQMAAALEADAPLPDFTPSMPGPPDDGPHRLDRPDDLLFDNGLGGFTPDGRDYVIHLDPGDVTPAPWANILANDGFGCLLTESGGGYSWALNSGENRLTPWSNDPVTDRPSEALFLRDEESAALWSVAPAPAGRAEACQVRHGAGRTSWLRHSHGLEQEMIVVVPPDAPVKLVRLRLRNRLKRHRRLTATYHAEWLLGAVPSLARSHVLCDYEPDAHAILATSWWNPDFAGRTAFLASSRPPHGLTTDPVEFLGREQPAARPAALARWGLSGTLVAGGPACAALQLHVDLEPEGEESLVFVLGQGRDPAEAKALARRWACDEAVRGALDANRDRWDRLLGAVEVEGPDPAFDLMVNRWLLYQSLSGRILGRTGFYQSSGAIGFRDQLQDVLALLHSDPGRARSHILHCAGRQFEEGDVLHWWHPPADRGVRTRCSDDLAWLPYAAATYALATGDLAIFEEREPFLQGPPLAEHEEDLYARFDLAEAPRKLIDHCERALERSLTRGAHDLPLIGGGDWNDGMNRVGQAGRGESVWLAWFLSVTADLLAQVQSRRGETSEAARWRDQARRTREAAEEAGWDGAWYRRAYDDDGHPLGSAEAKECRIDSISQSWAAFARASPERVGLALDSAVRELVDREAGLARLLWPPFDRTLRDPGYIKAYPPGIRENGGQYSHAAAWLGLALAGEGRAGEAMEVFRCLNPILHGSTSADIARYRVEPYVMAADIAAAGPHRGRGGWTWYTGSAAWAWRLAVEGLLGVTLHDGKVRIAPCLPAGWGGFRVTLRRPGGAIRIAVEAGAGSNPSLFVGGAPHAAREIAFPTDGSTLEVTARPAR